MQTIMVILIHFQQNID